MIDTSEFAIQTERELRHSRVVTPPTCAAWKSLSLEAKTAFAGAMSFLGCQPEEVGSRPDDSTRELDRIAAARLMLVKLGADGDDPRWSSETLDRLFHAVTGAPGGSVGDLFHALNGLLKDYPRELSTSLANFIKDLVVKAFTCYRGSYQSVDWRGLVQTMSAGATKPQLYLALHAIPPHLISPAFAQAITAGLETSPFRKEAASALTG